MKRRRVVGKFFVGDRACASLGAAISYAQNLASHWPKGEDRTFYVRDALDVCLIRVDLVSGVVYTTEVKPA